MTGRSRLAVLVCCVLFAGKLRGQDVDRLLKATADIRGMSEQELIDLVPKQSGLQYVDCPNCTAGRQERQLAWTFERPDEVFCRHCGHRYPSQKYPAREAVVVRTPAGNTARYDYWEDASGDRHFFRARRDDEVRRYLSSQALMLARLSSATKDKAQARRAAVILDRFAQVFPDWCYHYDYPFRPTVIYDGDVSPAEFRPGFRTARWNWWAYRDIPSELVEAYKLIRDTGVFAELSKERGTDVALRIENDLFRNAGEQVFANRDDLSNMSPGMWTDLAELGEVLEEPRYVHEVVRRFKRLVATRFYYDGTWFEGAPSYGKQTVQALQGFARRVRGYSDPAGAVDPVDHTRFDNLNLEDEFPQLRRAMTALERLRFPDGAAVPVHDTWAHEKLRRPLLPPSSYLLPALGHGCFKAGADQRLTEWHLSWSGGYGHQHADVLGLLLFANRQEALSDLGYTHTAYRAWTLATAAHNTVVINGRSQAPGSKPSPTDGSLELFDMRHPGVQAVQVDGRRAYPGLARTYQRTLVVVDDGRDRPYAIDVFDVEGGSTHDYFLHGTADLPGTVSTAMPLEPRETLLPAGMQWTAPTHEGEAGRAYQPFDPYGFLQKLRSGPVSGTSPVAVEFTVHDRPAVRVSLLAEPESELVLGENPAIRGADENDAELQKFWRPFLMLRHRALEERSRFVAMIEPRSEGPGARTVKRLEANKGVLALEVKAGDSVQLVVMGAAERTVIHGQSLTPKMVQFQGEIGVLMATEGRLASAYSIGEGGWQAGAWQMDSPGRQTRKLVGLERDALIVSAGDVRPPVTNDVLRLVTADGWVYPFTVIASEREGDDLRIRVAEELDFDFDADGNRLQLRCFPQRSHSGEVRVDWLAGVLEVPEQ